jgi:hypothetical protein
MPRIDLKSMRARARALAPMPLRQAVRALRRTVEANEKVLFQALRGTLIALEAKRSVTYRVATAADLASLGATQDYDPAAIALLTPRLDEGDRLVLAERDREVLFSGWVSVGAIELPVTRVAMPSRLAYAYKLFTRADQRGAGLMRGFYGHIARALLGDEIEGIVATVATRNQVSQRAHERIGFRPLGRLWDLRVGRAAITVADRSVAGQLGRRLALTYG